MPDQDKTKSDNAEFTPDPAARPKKRAGEKSRGGSKGESSKGVLGVSRRASAVLLVGAALLLTAGAGAYFFARSPQEALPVSCESRAVAPIGGRIALIDQQGREVTEASFRGAPSLIFFGFANCPDICPFSLQVMGEALSLLGPEGAAQIQPIFITVDPERDTTDILASYVENDGFPENLMGLTGSPEQIDQAAKAFKVDYSKKNDPNAPGGYRIGHSSLFYLMDENWKLVTFFNSTTTPREMATCISAHLDGKL